MKFRHLLTAINFLLLLILCNHTMNSFPVLRLNISCFAIMNPNLCFRQSFVLPMES